MTLDQIIKRGLELGLEAVEVYASTTESNSLKLDEGKLESYSMKELFSVSIRGLKNGKMASVTTESLDDEVVENLLQALVRNVDALDATEPEFMFEGGSVYQPVEELKSNYKDFTVAQKTELLKTLEHRCLAVSDKIVKVGYCQYSETSRKVQKLQGYRPCSILLLHLHFCWPTCRTGWSNSSRYQRRYQHRF